MQMHSALSSLLGYFCPILGDMIVACTNKFLEQRILNKYLHFQNCCFAITILYT